MDTRDTTRDPLSPGLVDAGNRDGGRDVRDIRTPAERAALRHGEDRSIGDLLKDLRDETTTLLRQEVALAKTEITEKVSKAARNTGYIGVGAVMAYLGLFFVLAAVTVALAMALDAMGLGRHGWWLSPLMVGAVIGLVGWSMTKKGINTLKEESLVPEKTVQSLQEDKQWLQEKVTK